MSSDRKQQTVAVVGASPKPERIIMNPDAENDDLAAKARKHGIEVMEGYTLVMLASGTF